MVLETVDVPGFISWFEGIGGFDVILPFFLIFAVTFAILEKVGIFEKKNINVVVSVILAFFLIMQGEMVFLIFAFLLIFHPKFFLLHMGIFRIVYIF